MRFLRAIHNIRQRPIVICTYAQGGGPLPAVIVLLARLRVVPRDSHPCIFLIPVEWSTGSTLMQVETKTRDDEELTSPLQLELISGFQDIEE